MPDCRRREQEANQAADFFITFQRGGGRPETNIRVEGGATSSTFTVMFIRGSTNVTSQVTRASGYSLPSNVSTLKVKITAKSNAVIKSIRDVTVTGTAQDGTMDAVKATVKVVL